MRIWLMSTTGNEECVCKHEEKVRCCWNWICIMRSLVAGLQRDIPKEKRALAYMLGGSYSSPEFWSCSWQAVPFRNCGAESHQEKEGTVRPNESDTRTYQLPCLCNMYEVVQKHPDSTASPIWTFPWDSMSAHFTSNTNLRSCSKY